jgi:SAM-dependent methyltransferase
MDTERWSAASWPFVRSQLPPAPAAVLELGCGAAGGFVPALRAAGYDAVGIDPNAPAGEAYRQVGFERYEHPHPVAAIVASRSLHHVGDLGDVLDRVAGALAPGGALVVVEWAWERFDDATARWCFERLGEGASDLDWLRRRRQGWLESGESWETYFRGWAANHGLHRGERILRELDARFDPVLCSHGPYFFADLPGTPEAEEEDAIGAGAIHATGIRYAGTVR